MHTKQQAPTRKVIDLMDTLKADSRQDPENAAAMRKTPMHKNSTESEEVSFCGLTDSKLIDSKDSKSANFCAGSQPFFPGGMTESNKENLFQDPVAFSNLYTYQISRMKAQHQYITNLQRANMALKNKIKQLEEIVTKEASPEKAAKSETQQAF